eukprot:TRINITY_DN30235_c0_g1_i2.p3 TRINITY_DN30235_c0_g1~~TRINITY_DN30235_c0_g1_i2.p3  ORF type:complete len:164 (+),score=23.94 TRINITY_DN30235_c0_g1_i2:253-744(+)
MSWAALVLPSLCLMWGYAAVAVLALALLHCTDPGEVNRCPENCSPIPGAVVDRIRAGRGTDGLVNIRGVRENCGEHASYCVRCCVWRRKSGGHHCSVCERCVTGFDHHCGVLGRCITSANMCYYRAIPVMGMMGAATALFTIMVWASSGPPGDAYSCWAVDLG